MMLKTRILLLLTVLILIAGCSKTSDWEKATRYYEAGKYKNAIKYFSKVREDTPSRENSADYMIGECYFKMEEYTKAKEAFKRIIVPQQTDNLVKLYMKALWEFNGGFHDKALPFLEIIVQTNPTFKEGNAFFYFIRATKTVHGVEKA
ncbi:MAG: tetratricopeptide repeat protein, partial [Hyphomicrobiaceae bacterium]|nr:tetratricopeptide repeat protein [Hyphomicrobiaceae bacterium]